MFTHTHRHTHTTAGNYNHAENSSDVHKKCSILLRLTAVRRRRAFWKKPQQQYRKWRTTNLHLFPLFFIHSIFCLASPPVMNSEDFGKVWTWVAPAAQCTILLSFLACAYVLIQRQRLVYKTTIASSCLTAAAAAATRWKDQKSIVVTLQTFIISYRRKISIWGKGHCSVNPYLLMSHLISWLPSSGCDIRGILLV